MAIAEEQPRGGATILHCGHLARVRAVAHWFKYEAVVGFKRPDGSHGEAEWLAVCEACFVRHGGRAPVRGDGVWTGDDPVIEREEN